MGIVAHGLISSTACFECGCEPECYKQWRDRYNLEVRDAKRCSFFGASKFSQPQIHSSFTLQLALHWAGSWTGVISRIPFNQNFATKLWFSIHQLSERVGHF